MDADPDMILNAPVQHLYELRSVESIEHDVLPGLAGLGYVVDDRREHGLTLLGLRRPRWAIALAIFLFPFCLPLLLIKRPRELRLEWRADQTVMLSLGGNDSAAAHAIASVAFEHEQPQGAIDEAAAPFAGGAVSVLVGWLAAVQLIDSEVAFAIAIGMSVSAGCGIGTLVGMRRAARADDPRSPVVWGTLPALCGSVAMTLLFVGLVALLLTLGAG